MSYFLIICNGEAPPEPLLKRRADRAEKIIAADGGLFHCLNAGITPDFLTGDLDSASLPYPDGVEVIHEPDQETNDLEKALELALNRGADQVLVLGATGLRLDQTLKNLSVLQAYHKQFRNIAFQDAAGIVQACKSGEVIPFSSGTSVSLFPISGLVSGIVTEGLLFPLNAEALENGVRDGSSNQIVAEPARVWYDSGCLLLIINQEMAELPWF